MSAASPTESLIARHSLAISDPLASIAFYQRKLGMSLVDTTTIEGADGEERRYILGFLGPDAAERDGRIGARQAGAYLDLVYRPDRKFSRSPIPDNCELGYWKIGITLPDVDLARAQLLAQGVDVSDAAQFLNVGYLCHLCDPDGYNIELLQHRFAENHQAREFDPAFALGSQPTLAQITLRISDPNASLAFYKNELGMRLLSRQVIEAYQFTLYFLAFTDEEAPHADLDSVNNREWLWRRPYTVLELQHRWRSRALVIGKATGFEGLTIARCHDKPFAERILGASMTTPLALPVSESSRETFLNDPDGYVLRITDLS